jgi:hypothetical protein
MSPARYLLFMVVAALLSACASERDLAAPAPSQAETHPLGCTVRLVRPGQVVQGELIGLLNGRYVLMNDDELLSVDTLLGFTRATVELGRVAENPNGFGWAAALPLVSISHGFFAAFSLPMNIITAVAVARGAAKRRHVIYLEPLVHAELCRFARFPQGVPPAFFEGKRWAR